MSAAYHIRTTGQSEIERQLFSLVNALEDPSPLMETIGFYGEASTLERFETETGPDGQRWPDSIRVQREGGKTLTDQAILKNSITSESGKYHAAWGTNLIYAGTHQNGATIRPKNGEHLSFRLPGGLGFRKVEAVEIPKREFLGISSEDGTEIIHLAEDYAMDAAPGIDR
jgi:phage gpG-like protein